MGRELDLIRHPARDWYWLAFGIEITIGSGWNRLGMEMIPGDYGIHLKATDPDTLKGLSPEKLAEYYKYFSELRFEGGLEARVQAAAARMEQIQNELDRRTAKDRQLDTLGVGWKNVKWGRIAAFAMIGTLAVGVVQLARDIWLSKPPRASFASELPPPSPRPQLPTFESQAQVGLSSISIPSPSPTVSNKPSTPALETPSPSNPGQRESL